MDIYDLVGPWGWRVPHQWVEWAAKEAATSGGNMWNLHSTRLLTSQPPPWRNTQTPQVYHDPHPQVSTGVAKLPSCIMETKTIQTTREILFGKHFSIYDKKDECIFLCVKSVCWTNDDYSQCIDMNWNVLGNVLFVNSWIWLQRWIPQ